MKNIIIILLFIALIRYQCFAQVGDKENDTRVYQSIICQHKFNNEPICDSAYLTTLKKIDFKKTNLDKWSGNNAVKNWESFFNQINVATLKEYKLTLNKIGQHSFLPKDLNKAKDYKHPFLALSPVIYSPDKTLAICSIWNYGNPEASSETVYLLQYKDNEWKVVKFLLVSIS